MWSVVGLSQQREKFLYGQSRKFLLKSASLESGRRTGWVGAEAEGTGSAEGTA